MPMRACGCSVHGSTSIDWDAALRQVRLIAQQMQRRSGGYADREELIGEGLVGLVEAARKFDPERNLQFRSYAEHRIRGAMQDYVRRLDPLPRLTRRRWREADKVIGRLRQELQREPEADEIADALRIPVDDWRVLTLLVERATSVAQQPHNSQSAPLCEPVSTDGTPEDSASRSEVGAAVRRALSSLPSRERRILTLRYVEDRTVEEIARQMGLHPSRVSQLQARAFDQLRAYWQRR